MPINVNGYGAQFDQFVEFAEAAIAAGKQKAIARVDTSELGGIVNRTIKPGTGDWVGIGVGRLGSLKKANNTTRDAFKKAVADMFGGETRIPASVLDAMKMSDYGKGKPLTARRIMAVRQAIDDSKSQVDSTISALKTTVLKNVYKPKNPGFNEQLDKGLEAAMKLAFTDNDLLAMLKDQRVLSSVLVSGNGEARSVESVERKVAALKGNLDELRAATKGNRAMYQAGLRELTRFGGKAFGRGCIAAMVSGAMAAKMDDIRALKGSSTIDDVHNAVFQYHTTISAVVKESKVLDSFGKVYGPEEIDGSRNFVGALMLSRLSNSVLRRMDGAFKSQAAGKVARLYTDLSAGKIRFKDADRKLVDLTMVNMNRISNTLNFFAITVAELLGEQSDGVAEYEGKRDEDMGQLAAGIYSDVQTIAKEEDAKMTDAERNVFFIAE
jgi:hypothetical protein